MAGLDAVAVQQDLSGAHEALQGAFTQVASEEREGQGTLAKKNRAIEEYERLFTGVATSSAGLFTLAGEQELPEKVRPSARRPGQAVEQTSRSTQVPPTPCRSTAARGLAEYTERPPPQKGESPVAAELPSFCEAKSCTPAVT